MDNRRMADPQVARCRRWCAPHCTTRSVMTDFIVLIRSNGNGDPVRGGTHGHWVEVTDNAHPVAVNQLAAGGKFPHADCGEACVKSILASRGKPEAIVTIEHDAKAGAAGTSTAGVRAALADFGVATTQTNSYPGKNTMPFRTVMNPLGGRVETGQQAAYKDAYSGVTIVCAVPVAAPKPAPKPVAPVAKPVAKPVAPVAPKPAVVVTTKPATPAAPAVPKPAVPVVVTVEPAAAPTLNAPDPVLAAMVASSLDVPQDADPAGPPGSDQVLNGDVVLPEVLPAPDIPANA